MLGIRSIEAKDESTAGASAYLPVGRGGFGPTSIATIFPGVSPSLYLSEGHLEEFFSRVAHDYSRSHMDKAQSDVFTDKKQSARPVDRQRRARGKTWVILLAKQVN